MGRLLLCLNFLLLFSTLTLSTNVHERCEFGIDAAKQSAKAARELAYKVFGKAHKAEENFVISPVSIALALALVESGASGETRTEIQRLLAPEGSNQLDSSHLYQSLQHQLQIKGGEKITLNIANGFFYSEGLNLKPEFVNKTKKCFETQVDKAPFKTNSEDARRQVNQWVSDKTDHKIPELFKARSIDASTVAVLANALHFKAAWVNRFDKNEILSFYKLGRDNQAQTVNFIVREGEYSHAENDKAQILEIPYEGVQSVAMYILLPKQRNGLQSLYSSASIKEEMKALAATVTPKKIVVKIPKFNIRSEIDLKTVLQQIGVNKIFSEQADFSRMTSGKLKISNAVHEAFIKVNENGTEGAASTGFAGNRDAGLPSRSPTFIADHPFGFYVVHKPTKAVLFVGKVVKVDQE